MGYLTFASQFEASSAALSTKCWNLQHNLYLLEDISEGKNGVCGLLTNPISLKRVFLDARLNDTQWNTRH